MAALSEETLEEVLKALAEKNISPEFEAISLKTKILREIANASGKSEDEIKAMHEAYQRSFIDNLPATARYG